MKVLLLIHRLTHGGAQRQLVALARGLAGQGHEVTVVSFYPGGALAADLDEGGVTHLDLGKRGRWDLVGFGRRAAGLLRRIAPDVLYSFLIAPNLLAAVLGLLRPDTRVVWGVRASEMDLGEYDWLARASFRTGCVLARLPDRIIANSEAGRSYHTEQGYPAEKLRVIPNGIDTGRFRPDVEARLRSRRSWNVEDGAEVIGNVARLDPMKDHVTFLEAAALLRIDRPRARFVCIGGGPDSYRILLEQKARELHLEDAVVWAGDRDDVAVLYNGFDVATSSSAYGEGFPNAVAEALATGLTCVATDVGDSDRLVSGPRLVPPRDAARLARSWLDALESPDDGVAGRLRIEQNFSIEAMVRRTERELEALA